MDDADPKAIIVRVDQLTATVRYSVPVAQREYSMPPDDPQLEVPAHDASTPLAQTPGYDRVERQADLRFSPQTTTPLTSITMPASSRSPPAQARAMQERLLPSGSPSTAYPGEAAFGRTPRTCVCPNCRRHIVTTVRRQSTSCSSLLPALRLLHRTLSLGICHHRFTPAIAVLGWVENDTACAAVLQPPTLCRRD